LTVSAVPACRVASCDPVLGCVLSEPSGTDCPPQITHPPTPQSAIFGGRAHFTVIASGTGPLSYQWRRNGSPLSDGGTVSGATTDVLTLTGLAYTDAAGYSVVVSNTWGIETSPDAALSLAIPQPGDVDTSFDAGGAIDGTVYDMAIQSDGKAIIGGSFTSIQGGVRGRVARLNT